MRKFRSSLFLVYLVLLIFATLGTRHMLQLFLNPYPRDWFPSPLPTYPISIQERADYVKDAFVHSFNGYRDYAWGYDEVRPITGEGHNPRNGWAATIVDSLDTMLLMNLTEEYELSRELVETIDFKETSSLVNVFETTIRYLGGLLSAYDLTQDSMYLEKAIDLGQGLLPAFNTPSHIPLQYVDLKRKTGVHSGFPGYASCLAEFGSLQLEFRRLTELSGDPIYLEKAQKIIDILQSKDTDPPGLYPVYMDPKTATFTTSWISWGGLGDSFYEYLLKQYIMVEGATDQYLDMWLLAVDSTKKHLIHHGQGFPNMTYLSQLWNGKPYYEMSNLACFAGGNFLLGGKVLNDTSLIELGINLTDTCYRSYEGTETGIGAESWAYVAEDGSKSKRMNRKKRDMWLSKGFYVTDATYYLRPEVIESIFYAYRVTGDTKYQDWGWNIFKAIHQYCKTPIGYSGINDVTDVETGWDNTAESFWYAETLKYLYLLFTDINFLPLDQWVFNTEAHPFKIGGSRQTIDFL